jgi:hypothetical protein
MYPIASYTVGSTSVASITFSSIPQNFTHLQLRGFMHTSGGGGWIVANFNGDNTQSNYALHYIEGSGSGVGSAGQAPSVIGGIGLGYLQSNNASIFEVVITDILDYTNTNKNKVTRAIGGSDENGSGYVRLNSGLWTNTSAITSIVLTNTGGNWVQYTTFQLYGITTA